MNAFFRLASYNEVSRGCAVGDSLFYEIFVCDAYYLDDFFLLLLLLVAGAEAVDVEFPRNESIRCCCRLIIIL